MRSLFLDIASHHGALSCVRDDAVLSFRAVSTRIRDHELIPLAEELLKEAGWHYEDLTHVACVVGPGGFTSLRIAVSFANTLIDQLGIRGAGIHLSDLYHARVEVSEPRLRNTNISGATVRLPQPDVVWLHATKRDALFVCGFGKHKKLWPEPVLLSVDEGKEQIPPGAFWMGEMLDEHRNILAPLALQEATLRSIDSVLPSFLASAQWNTTLLQPWYGRAW